MKVEKGQVWEARWPGNRGGTRYTIDRVADGRVYDLEGNTLTLDPDGKSTAPETTWTLITSPANDESQVKGDPNKVRAPWDARCAHNGCQVWLSGDWQRTYGVFCNKHRAPSQPETLPAPKGDDVSDVMERTTLDELTRANMRLGDRCGELEDARKEHRRIIRALEAEIASLHSYLGPTRWAAFQKWKGGSK